MTTEHRIAHGVLLDKTIALLRLGKDPIKKIEQTLDVAEGEPRWSHHQVAVPKKGFNLESLGFLPTSFAIPLPGEAWGTTSYRRGPLHAHEAGPVYLIHKDADEPGLGHLLRDVPGALKKRILENIEPFVKEKSAMRGHKHKHRKQEDQYDPTAGLQVGGGSILANTAGAGLTMHTINRDTHPSALYDNVVANSPVPIRPGASPAFNPQTAEVQFPEHSRNAAALAHELGHADIHNSGIGRLLQNPVTLRFGNAAPLIGAVSGIASGLSDDERAQQLGIAAPAIAATPQLLYEGGASLQGLRRMHAAGATRGQLLRGAGTVLAPAFMSYAANAGLGVGAAMAGQKVTQGTRKEASEYAAFLDELERIEKQAGLADILTSAGFQAFQAARRTAGV